MKLRILSRTMNLLFITVLLLSPFSAFASPLEQDSVPIDPDVLTDLADDGVATYWALFDQQADLSGASQIGDWNARGQYVYDQLTSLARETQTGLIADLEKAGVDYTPFWIINAIRVTSGSEVLDSLSREPALAEIKADWVYELPEPIPAPEEGQIDAVEWNIARINAPQVWSTFGVRGEGIVVANIDTGVQYNHPALVTQYRGNLGGGVFDHNFNWFDPSLVCGNPSLVPCDNNGHGTHTMGTMVGDDGGANQIGVAPGARYIMAKGCETNSCSSTALLASAQWVLAPTDLSGANPRADLRPHVVNNSWGGGGGDPWYQASVNAWIASGIFPAFSNGNSGSSCNTSGSPGDYVQSYSSGAFDINNNIAGFSSRGPSAFGGEIKPNIAAPGVSVRSSVPTNSYSSFSGTSMASPHTAAAVALMWSAAPALMGDISGTRALLDQTAIDTSDLQCGGTAADNNVWGEGRLDALAAVSQSPIGATGSLQGNVTDANTNLPISAATIQAVGPIARTTTTNASGAYSFPVLSVGSYDVTASKFGYLSQFATSQVITDTITVQDFALVPAPSYSVSGFVTDSDGNPVPNARVTILGTPIPPATTDATGFYSFASVPAGSYNVQATAGRCNDPLTLPLNLTGDVTDFNFALPQRSDAYGYFCRIETPAYIEASTVLPLTGDDAALQVSLPFPFTFYGNTYNTAWLATNGHMNFLASSTTFSNVSIPATTAPNAAIYPFWDDLFVDASASVRSELLGAAPNRMFVIEWRNVRFFGDTTRRLDFEVILTENGRILTQYRNIANDGRERGNSATLGIENATGTIALQYSFNQANIDFPEFAVLYRLPPSAFVEGVVTDYNDSLPLAGATIKAYKLGALVQQTTSDADGFYRLQLRLGEYTIEASKTNYAADATDVNLAVEDATYTADFALMTARGEVTPAELTFLVPMGEQRTQYLTLSNTGSISMTWEINEVGGSQIAAGFSGPRVAPVLTPGFDPNAKNTQSLYPSGTTVWMPTAPGDILKQWTPTGLALAWGVGYDGDVWLSDVPNAHRVTEFTVDGALTGASWPMNFGGTWEGDMAYDAGRGWMCQVNVGGDNGIYCWDPADGSMQASITGAFPWASISQRGLAYRPDDDTFYIGGWNQGVLYHVKGLSWDVPGQVIGQCNPADPNISGLAWNPAFGIVWAATNSATDTIYALNPTTCATITTLAHPSPGFDGAGLEMDAAGNLWMIDQDPSTVFLIDSGIPNFTEVPWLSEEPTSGTLAAGASQQIVVTANTTGLIPGVYTAELIIGTNSGRMPQLRVPVRLIVPAYFVGVNAGGSQYMDVFGETWSADQAYAAGSWGYLFQSTSFRTRSAIEGTDDDPLFQATRRGQVDYRFDNLMPGVYQVELRFAEIQNQGPNQRQFDVIVEGNYVLPAHDISAEAGINAADDHTFYVMVLDGSLNVRFVTRRSFKEPLIAAIRVIHRPDF